ncbi:MAG TPA: alpha/beta hydrolase [Spongiibacteraceae bacterium]|nr:alpha/beta hydrolase [Spongiibacteraceae bacterium]
MSAINTIEPSWLARALAQPGLSHWAEIDGNRLHYLEWPGPVAAPTILLVHGFRAQAHWWDFTAPLLAADFRVIALDLGGMGDSSHRAIYSHRSFADDIATVAKHAGLRDTILIGQSFGGIVAVDAAYHYPELFARTILIDSKVSFADDDHRTDGPPAHPPKMRSDRAIAQQRFRVVPEQEGIDAAILQHIAQHSLRQIDGMWTWKFDPLCAAPDLVVADQHESDMLRQLTMPVDFIYGEHSAIIPREFARRVGKCIRKGRAPIEIPDARHHILLDQPLALVATLRALLAPNVETAR